MKEAITLVTGDTGSRGHVSEILHAQAKEDRWTRLLEILYLYFPDDFMERERYYGLLLCIYRRGLPGAIGMVYEGDVRRVTESLVIAPEPKAFMIERASGLCYDDNQYWEQEPSRISPD